MEKEILAPVGDYEMLLTAINSGADAVYLGGSMFNARMKAENFEALNLKKSVELAHLFGVKVYLTLNTLVNDDETEKLLLQINDAINAKVDAFIVQDYGVALILKKYFKNIVLHASTQMGVHNLEGALLMQQLGFSRVVLSREATIEDVKLIKQNTNLEIEYFVHGALCVAFSGNCYLSSKLKNKSGNRGECLQLCRLLYTSKDKNNNIINNGYLISPRDLCYLDKIKELASAGVDSFKIEGRLKRPAYVAKTVISYKKALSSNYNKNDIVDLRKIFSRGEFNFGEYVVDSNSNIINKDVQNHLGIKIGTVVKVEKFKDLHKISLKVNHNLQTGDGLKFISKNGYVNSLGVGNVENKNGVSIVYSKCFPNEQDDVYLTVDTAMEQKLLGEQRKILLKATFVASVGKPARLELTQIKNENKSHSQSEKVEIFSNFVCENAQKSAILEQNVIKNLSKTNNTHFQIVDFDIKLQGNIFMPLVEINNMRRLALQQLEAKIIERNSNNLVAKSDQELKEILQEINSTKVELKKPNNFVVVQDVNQLTDINKEDNIIFSPEIYSTLVVNKFFEELKNNNINNDVYLDLPIISNYKDIQILSNILNNYPNLNVVANNPYAITLGKDRKVVLGIYMNIANKMAVKHLMEKVTGVAVFESVEYFAKANVKNIMQWNGEVSLATFKHCPFQVSYGCSCKNCAYAKGLSFTNQAGKTFIIKRKKIANCYFSVVEQN